MTGLQTVRTDIFIEQGVAVVLRNAVPFEDLVRIVVIVLRKVADRRFHQKRKVVRRRQMLRVWPAGSIATGRVGHAERVRRSEEHTSELPSLMRISYAVFCLQNKKTRNTGSETPQNPLHMTTVEQT